MLPNKKNGIVIDLRQVADLFLKNWYYFFTGILLATTGAVLFVKYSIPKYSISSKVYIKADNSINNELINGFDFLNSEKEIEDEIGVLKSFSINRETLKKIGFYESYFVENRFSSYEVYKDLFPFKIMVDTNSPQVANVPVYINILPDNKIQLKAIGENVRLFHYSANGIQRNKPFSFQLDTIIELGKPFKLPYFSITVVKNMEASEYPEGKLFFKINDLDKQVEAYSDRILIEPISKNSSILLLSIEGTIVQREKAYLDNLCKLYLEKELNEKNHIAVKTINFIDQQVHGVEDSLREAEAVMENLRMDNNIIDLGYEAKGIYDQFKDIENQRASEIVRSRYYEYLLQYVEKNEDIQNVTAPSAIGIADPLLNNLINQIAQLHTEKASIAHSMKEKNPYFSILNNKIASLKSELKENIKSIKKGSEIIINGFDERIAQIEKRLDQLPVNERKLINVQRKYTLNDNIYTFLLQRRAEAGIIKASNSSDSEIIDFARVDGDEPVYPKSKIIYLVAIFFGFTIPFGIVVLKESLNDKIRKRSDVENNTSVPLLAIIRHKEKWISNKSVFSEPKSPIAESFRSLRVNLNFLSFDSVHKTVAISSSISGEGKSFCALNLSYALALSGVKTVLINADLRLPYLHKEFGIANDKGLSNFLINKAEEKDIICKTELPDLDFISSGPIPPNPFDLLSSDRLGILLKSLKEKYEYLIIDTPPLGLVSDYFLISRHTDATIYVVRHDYSKLEFLHNLDRINKKNTIKKLFIVLNDYKKDIDSYGNYLDKYSGKNKNGYGKSVFVNIRKKIESINAEPFNH